MTELNYLSSPEWLEHLAARKANTIALNNYYEAIKLTTHHTRVCANATEKVTIQTGLTAFKSRKLPMN